MCSYDEFRHEMSPALKKSLRRTPFDPEYVRFLLWEFADAINHHFGTLPEVKPDEDIEPEKARLWNVIDMMIDHLNESFEK